MDSKNNDLARVGRSVVIKGDLSGSEDLVVDGKVEGSIELPGNSLTIGPNGQVSANVNAKTVVVHGKIDGNIRSSDRTELRKSAVAAGDIFTQRISIEDGAYFRGRVEIQKAAPGANVAPTGPRVETKPEPGAEVIPSAVASSGTASTSATDRTAVTDIKKF
ncbi:MAG: polymer-forming cytoskeletal protein [Acidobacteriota bacterium]|nr:polymer-forming cytoskeletal protein [Acidobacteriota bacterium]